MMLEGRCGVIVGVANKRSLAWAIARRLDEAGSRLLIGYQDPLLEGRVLPLVESLRDAAAIPCNVTRDDEIHRLFREAKERFGEIDFLVHSVAYANREDLDGAFVDTSREGFALAHEVSAYSLVALAREAAPLMENRGSSIVALTYLGATRVFPRYNVMGAAKASLEAAIRYLANDLGPRGIRVNGISAGPVNTLSARGIAGFLNMLAHVKERAPLRRNTEPEEVADAALFLVSSLSRGMTGDILMVDGGYHILGV